MTKRIHKQAQPNPGAAEMQAGLARRIAQQGLSAGEHATAIPGLWLFRRTTPTACYRAAYEPSLTVFVQGRKRINLGGTEYICGAGAIPLVVDRCSG
jgi:AraC-type transcriptional regulator N-terminus